MEMMPESMGYDRAIVVFSPDGRLFQVEYAREAVKRGATAVGVTFKDGVIFGVKKRESALVKPGEKIFKLDSHIAAATSGLVADARVLVDTARVRAQQNRMIYDEPISVATMARYIADRQQVFTQYAGVRPYGVSFLIAGVNDEGKLFETDPSGLLLECKAKAIGKSADKINELFEKKYTQDMSEKDAVQLIVDAFKKEGKITLDDLVIHIITKDNYKEPVAEYFTRLGIKI
ncbi:MAG: archaeal proteasome endopeptidase complex subunit alpha [archaeon]